MRTIEEFVIRLFTRKPRRVDAILSFEQKVRNAKPGYLLYREPSVNLFDFAEGLRYAPFSSVETEWLESSSSPSNLQNQWAALRKHPLIFPLA